MAKWKIPSCFRCNQTHAANEGNLLVSVGLCIPPDEAANTGIAQKALRAFDAAAGRSSRDAAARAAHRQRILGQTIAADSIPDHAIYPGFGPQPGIHGEEQIGVLVEKDSLNRFIEKTIRGLEYIVETRFIEPPYAIDVFPPDHGAVEKFDLLIRECGRRYDRGPGISVVRAPAPDDKLTALYRVEIWGRHWADGIVSRDDAQRQR